ncbi:MAG: response regulator, partial [Isosphaeraceae bacterium]
MVEDNLDYALGLRRLLESAGHEVQICNHGLGAISQAPAFVPDVILLDLGLPGMDGYEVARRMRENESLARTKIVVISGYYPGKKDHHKRVTTENTARPSRRKILNHG